MPRISCDREENEHEETKQEKGMGGSDTRGSSKEDAIVFDGSESETEAIKPEVAAPVM